MTKSPREEPAEEIKSEDFDAALIRMCSMSGTGANWPCCRSSRADRARRTHPHARARGGAHGGRKPDDVVAYDECLRRGHPWALRAAGLMTCCSRRETHVFCAQSRPLEVALSRHLTAKVLTSKTPDHRSPHRPARRHPSTGKRGRRSRQVLVVRHQHQ